MHFIIKLFPEIIVKSPAVRQRMTRKLRANIRRVLHASKDERLIGQLELTYDWEKIELKIANDDHQVRELVVERLSNTPGIVKFSEVLSLPFESLEQAAEVARVKTGKKLTGKTFCVRVKRHGNHDFKSTDAERSIGSHLMSNTAAAGVDLKNPDVNVELEIKHDRLFFVGESWRGIGGYPMGEQDAVLSMISGGFDSSVASYMTMKRGLLTHFLFFNLGGRAHELGVKQAAHLLWKKYSSSHDVTFLTVPFEGVVAEILENIPRSYMGVALKRMMYRAAEIMAKQYKVSALVTGESVAQVSSQTLENLRVIETVVDSLVLRPLITENKEEIIATSREIGTFDLSVSMPEYCGVISSHPTTRAKKHIIEDAEKSFDFKVLEDAIANHQCEKVSEVLSSAHEIPVDVYTTPKPGAKIVDVRHPDEISEKPLAVHGEDITEIPYFRLNKEFTQMDPKVTHLLYCDKGVMSRLHAEMLIDSGFNNVGVYSPDGQSLSRKAS